MRAHIFIKYTWTRMQMMEFGFNYEFVKGRNPDGSFGNLLVGQGGYGRVCKAVTLPDNAPVTVKVPQYLAGIIDLPVIHFRTRPTFCV